MGQFFWESKQKARRSHFCDFCCNEIARGDTYHRMAWRPRGSLAVIRQHADCPPNEIEEEMVAEMARELAAAACVPLAYEIRMREVVMSSLNGDPITVQETELVLTIESVPYAPEEIEDDIPF